MAKKKATRKKATRKKATRKKAAANMIEVRINADQVVHYCQTVTMPLEEWENLNALDDRRLGEALEGWLDVADVYDADDIEITYLKRVDTGEELV